MDFTPENIASQSASNLNSYILLTMAYFKAKGESPRDWLHYIGEKFVETWPSLQDATLPELAEGIILNNLSGGAKLVSRSGNDTKVEIIFDAWPPKDLLAFSGISWEEAQLIHEVLAPVFAKVGINYTWKIHARQVIIELSR